MLVYFYGFSHKEVINFTLPQFLIYINNIEYLMKFFRGEDTRDINTTKSDIINSFRKRGII